MVSFIRASLGCFLGVSALTLCLVGCDDDDGGGLVYTGVSEAATITEENGEGLITDAYKGTLTGTAIGFATGVGGQEAGAKPRAISVYKALASVAEKLEAPTVSNGVAAAISLNDTITGSCGGSASFGITVDEQTTTFDGSVTFNNFCEEDTTLSGTTRFSGQFSGDGEEFGEMTFSFSAITVTSPTDSYTISGDLTLTSGAGSEGVAMDLLIRDNQDPRVLWINDLTLTVTPGLGYEDIQVSGRFYDPDEGYIDLATGIALRIQDGEDFPSAGTLVATGANGEITLTAISNVQYQVEIDIGSDGNIEVTVTGTWTAAAS